MLKEKVKVVIDYIAKHSRIVFPVIVIVAVAATVSLALGAESTDKLASRNGENASVEETAADETAVAESTEMIPMVLNEDPMITSLIATFYNAMALGDTETLMSVCDEINSKDLFRYQEQAKYIELYPTLDIYTKPGPEEGTTIAFIYYKVVFADHEEQFPGYAAHYVCTNEQGELYICRSEISDEANEYITQVMSQDDVVEFHNRVTVEYNDLMEANPELLEYLSEMDAQVSAAVGVALAQENAEETQQEAGTIPEEGAEGTETTTPENGETVAEGTEQANEDTPVENVVQYATATTTVNVRSSDSEQADKLGKVSGGSKLQILEQKVNGWTKVLFEGKEGYIKSEYLELAESAEGVSVIGSVTATTNINVRATANESAEKLGVLIGGGTADLLANENGWCKINYEGQVGYVKADYVQVN